ncbi:MAG: copper amine oxidase N-terminal domain-containing protein [Armatimonadota bacterium]
MMRFMTVAVVIAVTLVCWAADGISLVANGKTIHPDTPPRLHAGRVYVPLRAAAEAVDGEVTYSPQAKRVTICRGDVCTFVRQREGLTINGRLLVAIRQLGEALNARVDWDSSTRTVQITTPE